MLTLETVVLTLNTTHPPPHPVLSLAAAWILHVAIWGPSRPVTLLELTEGNHSQGIIRLLEKDFS